MSKKKSSYKKKYKGVRYIAQRLTKYQKRKYPSYSKALPDARKFFNQLKKENKKVIIKNIWQLSRKRRAVTKTTAKGKPQIDKNLTDLSYYFETIDYPTWILRCPNNVWFVSEISPSALPDIQGGSAITYEDYFADYVNYINAMKLLSTPGANRYETDWLVTCTEPKYNKAKKRYESKIISVNSNGERTSYGFDPKKPHLLPKGLQVTQATQPTKQPTTTQPTTPKSTKVVDDGARAK